VTESEGLLPELEHFQEKWIPVFRRKCDQLKKLERVSDSSKSKRALVSQQVAMIVAIGVDQNQGRKPDDRPEA